MKRFRLATEHTEAPQSTMRRSIVRGVAKIGSVALLAPGHLLANPKSSFSGCCLMHGGESLIAHSRLSPSLGASGHMDSSGNPRFDRALGTVLSDLATRFKVRPGFGYFDDRGIPNALALPDSRLPASQGTVLFGREMLAHAMKGVHGDMFVMGICAHEFAHIVQFFSNFYERLTLKEVTKKKLELHADFLSGYYIGLRNITYTPSEMVALGRSWESLGDSNYTDPQHHGTEQERIAALEQGYWLAKNRPEFGIQGACEVGARYLAS